MNGRINEVKVLLDAFEKKKKETDLRHRELSTEGSKNASFLLTETKYKMRHTTDELDEVLERVRARISIPDLNGIAG